MAGSSSPTRASSVSTVASPGSSTCSRRVPAAVASPEPSRTWTCTAGSAYRSAGGHLLKPAVGERDRHRALADRGRHALRRATSHIARCEQARQARLEGERVALERPARGTAALVEQVGAGEDEAGAIVRTPLSSAQAVRGAPRCR